jgi:putative peptidoglycan lipid II flippase
MATGTVVSRITGIARDIAMTAALGFFITSDAFSLGNTLPNILAILVAGGALNAVFIPQLVRHIKDDVDGGSAYADRLLTVVSLWLIIVTAVAMAFAPQLVSIYASSDYTPAHAALATAFARWCLPQIVFYGLFTMWSQVLNARGRFAAPMFAPIVNNLVSIATFIAFMDITTHAEVINVQLTSTQVAVLGAGTTLGVIAQAFTLVPVLLRTGYRYRPRFDLRGNGLGHAGSLAMWTLGLVVVNQLAYIVVTRLATSANAQAVAAGATAEGLTTYQKAHLVFMLPHSVITVSLVTALLPQLSRIAHAADLRGVGTSVASAIRMISSLIVPVAAILLVLAPQFTRLMFGFGAATSDSAILTGHVVQVFALGLLPFTLVYLLFRGWYALEDTRSPFWVTILINVVNLGLSIPLFMAAPLSLKVPALALSYSASYWVALVVAWPRLERRLGHLETTSTVRSLVRMTVAGVLSAGVGSLAMTLLADTFDTVDRPMLLALGLLVAVAMAAVYAFAAHAMRVEEIHRAVALLRRRLT